MACCLRHQAITWTNVDWSSVKSTDSHIRAISQVMPQASITKIHLKITHLKSHSGANELSLLPYLPGANELTPPCQPCVCRCCASLSHNSPVPSQRCHHPPHCVHGVVCCREHIPASCVCILPVWCSSTRLHAPSLPLTTHHLAVWLTWIISTLYRSQHITDGKTAMWWNRIAQRSNFTDAKNINMLGENRTSENYKYKTRTIPSQKTHFNHQSGANVSQSVIKMAD